MSLTQTPEAEGFKDRLIDTTQHALTPRLQSLAEPLTQLDTS